ncbi:MAG: hypothetical protein EA409_09365 [Saprospirales bacterium]|nr:MAG: hypothetical protein EA409_09365 [Saprospirales bacterium]
MIIKSIHIEGFGIFNDKKLDGFGQGLHLIYGENEAGKSTLLDFIQFTLSGYPRTRSQRRPPLSGGNHGGKIQFLDSQGREWELYHSGANRSISLFEVASGKRYDDERFFKELISDANEDIYKNIYAINLQELYDINSIQESGMKDRIYSLGTGVTGLDLRSLESGIQASANEFYRSGARTNFRLKDLSDEIHSLEMKLAEMSLSAEEYDRLQSDIEQLKFDVKNLDNELKVNNSEFTELSARLEVYPEYIQFEDAQNKLAELGEIPIIPDAQINQIQQLRQRRESLLDDLKKEIEDEKNLRFEIDKLPPKTELESLLPHLDLLKKDHVNFEFLLKEKESILASLKRSKKLKNQFLERMGEGFTEEVLSRFRNTLELREKGEETRARQIGLETDVRSLQERLKGASEKMEEFDLKVKMVDQSLHDHTISNEVEAGEARNKLASLEIQRDKFFHSLKTGVKGVNFYTKAALWLMVVIAIGSGVWIMDTHTYLAIVLLVVAFSVVVLNLLFRNQAGGQKEYPEPEKIQLGINELQQDLKKYEDLIEELTGQRHQWELSKGNHERIQKDLMEAQQELAKLLENWKNLLSDLDLPLTLRPQNTIETATNIDRFMEMREGIIEQEEQLEKVQEGINGFEVKLRNNFPVQIDQSSIFQSEQLIRSLEEYKKVDQRRRELMRQLEQISTRNGRQKERIAEIELDLESSLKHYGLNSIEGFEKHLLEQEKYKNLEAVRDKAVQTIETRFGRRALQEVIESMSGLDVMELENRKSMAESRLKDLKIERDNKMREVGQLQNSASAKLNRQELAESELRLASLKSELQAEYRNWMVARIAAKVVGLCKRKYQDTRQPEVIKKTAEIFSRITEGRYINLQTEIDKEELILTELSGRRKKLEQLSRGTREQLLLALRMGLIEQYEQGGAEPLPVVLDDVLVNFDDKRAATMAAQLLAFAEKRQVLLFTCHNRMRNLMTELGSEVVVIGD